MKKQCKKLLFLLFAAVLFLAGCNANVVDETNVAETEVQDSGAFCLYENGNSLYTIVQSAKANDVVTAAGSLCWSTFKNTYNSELPISDDWVADPTAIPADTAEILLGNTNRAESAEVYATMDKYVYRIACINNRIVIASSADSLLDDVLEIFFAQLQVDENGRITVPSDLDISLTREQAWHDTLVGVPPYDGGVFTGAVLKETWGFAGDNPSVMMGISETNADEFAAYIAKIQDEGFSAVLRADWGGVIAYQCDKENVSFYTYYTPSTNAVRIILDNSKTSSLEEFSYSCEPVDGEHNEIYLVRLKQQDPEIPETADYPNNGMLMMIKLADNSLFVIDGGKKEQIDSEYFMEIAREITGIPEGEKIRIACWFITHKHGDHIWGFDKVLKECADQLILERMMYNHKNGRDFVYDAEDPNANYHLPYENVLYHLPRTGETIQFGNVTMDILYTHEDWVNLPEGTHISEESTLYNDSSTVIRINIDGKTCLILGDINLDASDILLQYYTDEQLKADVVQVAHHGFNTLPELYKKINAKIGLFPVSRNQALQKHTLALESAETNCEESYFGSNETVGIRVVDNDVQVVCRKPVVNP